jgi:hypothetical protein
MLFKKNLSFIFFTIICVSTGSIFGAEKADESKAAGLIKKKIATNKHIASLREELINAHIEIGVLKATLGESEERITNNEAFVAANQMMLQINKQQARTIAQQQLEINLLRAQADEKKKPRVRRIYSF